ncbi:hypothetical protein D3C72_1022600 [compost metagenome]
MITQPIIINTFKFPLEYLFHIRAFTTMTERRDIAIDHHGYTGCTAIVPPEICNVGILQLYQLLRTRIVAWKSFIGEIGPGVLRIRDQNQMLRCFGCCNGKEQGT